MELLNTELYQREWELPASPDFPGSESLSNKFWNLLLYSKYSVRIIFTDNERHKFNFSFKSLTSSILICVYLVVVFNDLSDG
jgi:hypothetical protein